MAYNPLNPNGQATSANSAPVVIASDQTSVNVGLANVGGTTLAAEAKGTQASNFMPVQAAHDSGRTFISFTVNEVAGITTEALATITINKGGTTSSATNYTVTSGKTLRIQNISLQITQSNATMNNSLCYIVATSSGTVATTSPIVDILKISANIATTNAVGVVDSNLTEGIELASGYNLGIAHKEIATTATVSVSINSYEY